MFQTFPSILTFLRGSRIGIRASKDMGCEGRGRPPREGGIPTGGRGDSMLFGMSAGSFMWCGLLVPTAGEEGKETRVSVLPLIPARMTLKCDTLVEAIFFSWCQDSLYHHDGYASITHSLLMKQDFMLTCIWWKGRWARSGQTPWETPWGGA